jgi:hypothetical protein
VVVTIISSQLNWGIAAGQDPEFSKLLAEELRLVLIRRLVVQAACTKSAWCGATLAKRFADAVCRGKAKAFVQK